MSLAIDLATAATTPFTSKTDQHRAFEAFVGRWAGPTRTWLDPSAPLESETALQAELILGGRFLRIHSTSALEGKPHAGLMLIGFDPAEGRHEVLFVDSFHMSPGMMLSTGKPSVPGRIDVLGSYAAGSERWGWRTQLSLPSPDELLLRSLNITPAGEELPGVESHLRRR